MANLVKKSTATDWIRDGILCIESGKSAFLVTKERFFAAGKCFVKAKEATGAEWSEFLAAFIDDNTPKLAGGKRGEPPITDRTVRNYIALYEELIGLAKQLHPDAKEKELERVAVETMLDTPGGYMDVLRAVKLLRDPFAYDADKYQQKKIAKGNGQIEFNFDAVDSVLDSLSKIGTPQFILKLRPDQSRPQALADLAAKLEIALTQVKCELKTKDIES